MGLSRQVMSAIIIVTAYYFVQQGAQAFPISAVDASADPSCNEIHRCRTMWNIIWSCLSTIILCTWVAVHPNIPSPHATCFDRILRRIKLMAIALIAPEAIILWAIRQWLIAIRWQKSRGKGWTQTHAFFAIMGGFMLFVDGKPSYVLMRNEDTKFAPRLRDLKSIDFYFESGIKPITKEEIEDKSKADTLSKGLVALQTGWFTLQCMSRLVQHLPLTELELVTVGFAVLSLVTYILWWNKPLNVQCAFPVHNMVSTLEEQPKVEGGGEGEGEGEGENAGGAGMGSRADFVWRHLGRFVDSLFGHDHRHKFWHAMTVPTMFSGSLERRDTIIVGLIATIVATVFGAIHCIAWSFQFGSATEQLLWRLSSLAITCLPWPLWVLTTTIGSRRKLPVWLSVSLRTVGYTGTFLYVLARIVLLVLAFLSLKSLPPGAYRTVNWTTFIPHI